MSSKKNKVEVGTSIAFRTRKHDRDACEVKTSKPHRIPKYTRNPRSTKAEIARRGGTRNEIREKNKK
jgi:hypothetical protein